MLYAADDPDPVTAAPAGLRLDPVRLGHFKPAGTAEMATVAPLLSTGNRLERDLVELVEGGMTDG